MSYCMFENTFNDLSDCKDKLNEIMDLDDLSESESVYARRLIVLCKQIVNLTEGM